MDAAHNAILLIVFTNPFFECTPSIAKHFGIPLGLDQFFYPDRQNGESDCRQHIDRLLNTMDEKELTVMEATAEGLQKARETEVK